jgi:hypothetical protein
MLLLFIIALAGLIPGLGLFLLKRWILALTVIFFIFALFVSYMSASASFFYPTVDWPQNIRLGLIAVIWIGQYIYSIKLASQLFEDDEFMEEEVDMEPDPDAEYLAGGEIPPEYYLDETAILRGWPGNRSRPHRLGLDPLENDFELAHMEGLFIRHLITGTLITTEPIYLFLMAFIGVLSFIPSLLALLLVFFESSSNVILVIIMSPLLFFCVGLFVSFRRSMLKLETEKGNIEA